MADLVFVVDGMIRLAGASTDQYFLYSSGDFITKGTDTYPNVAADARLLHPGTYERHFWTPGQTINRSSVSLGYIQVANGDGVYDFLLDASIDGRNIIVRYGYNDLPVSSLTQLFWGIGSTIEVDGDTLHLNLKDFLSDMWDKPLQPVRFAGNNSLPNGFEGTANDIGGKFKPILIGDAMNFEPPCVNTSALIYQISAHQVTDTIPGRTDPFTVYNGLAYIPSAGGNQASLAALQSSTPAAGTYTYYVGNDAAGEGAYFKLGSSPGSLPVTSWANTSPYVLGATTNTVDFTTKAILNYSLPYSTSLKTALLAGIVNLGTSIPPAVLAGLPGHPTGGMPSGYWAGLDGATVGQALDEVLAGYSACLMYNRLGVFSLVRLDDPTSLTSIYSFTADDILSFDIINDDSIAIPPYSITINNNKVWRIMTDTEVAGSVTQGFKEYRKREYRAHTLANAAIWDPVAMTGRNPQSVPMTFNATGGGDYYELFYEATRLQAVYSPTASKRRYVKFTISNWLLANSTIDLGSIITVTYPRYGFGSGKKMMITGLLADFQNNQLDIFCWG